ncbi:MAG: S8 family serine peptidase [Bdellovibrionales bacterium]
MDYAIEKGVDVISASWGATISAAQAKPLIEAVQRASDAGVIFVAAAANDGRNNDATDVFPANAEFANTISVAASGSNDQKPQWSNYGRRTVHLASPGLDIMSTLPNNRYDNLSGTSMATPLVAGLVALLKSQNPELTGQDARALLQTTGAKVSIETACNCRIDAGEAMSALVEKRMFISPAAMTLSPSDSAQF